MENAITVSVSPLQALIGLVFQIWIVVFPIILIRKLNHLTALVNAQRYDEDEEDHSEPV